MGPNHGLSNGRFWNCYRFGLNALAETLLKMSAKSSVILSKFSFEGVNASSFVCSNETLSMSMLSINLSYCSVTICNLGGYCWI